MTSTRELLASLPRRDETRHDGPPIPVAFDELMWATRSTDIWHRLNIASVSEDEIRAAEEFLQRLLAALKEL
jgi:hypothetical protein